MTFAQAPSERTRVKRHGDRADYDAATITAILDEALIAHVAYVREDTPMVIPFAYVRVEDAIYFHGARRNVALAALANGAQVAATVTLIDGLVLARSQFHHSMNYRSVVVFGRGEEVIDPVEKARSLEALVERISPGRAKVTRPSSESEMRATLVVRLPIAEASAKVRQGPPVDASTDLAIPCWAGEIPLATTALSLRPDEHVLGAPALPTLPWGIVRGER